MEQMQARIGTGRRLEIALPVLPELEFGIGHPGGPERKEGHHDHGDASRMSAGATLEPRAKAASIAYGQRR
ncbi:MAG: hypothetical protein ACREYE_32510 [Gammaproteobacteria bacterium]